VALWNSRCDAFCILFQRPPGGKPLPARSAPAYHAGWVVESPSRDFPDDRAITEENNMKSNSVSLRRRSIVIGGFAVAAAPALPAAGLDGTAAVATMDGQGGLVISGRILARDGRPLTGATVEILGARDAQAAATATTDGDGRFYAAVPSGRRGRPSLIRYRVSRNGRTLAVRELRFARGRQVAERQAGHLQRDDSGAWRAAFGLALA